MASKILAWVVNYPPWALFGLISMWFYILGPMHVTALSREMMESYGTMHAGLQGQLKLCKVFYSEQK